MDYGFNELSALACRSQDSRIDDWFLMSSPVNITLITLAYILVVLRVGPSLMKNRNAYNLRQTLAIYNFFQIIYNFYLFVKVANVTQAITSLMKDDCKIERTDETVLECLTYAWLFLINKIIDFLDTIFMILRKKNDQITFLHVYHHAAMVLIAWITLKYIGVREEFGIVGALNAGVHVIMYFYYLVGAMGPQYQKYLWWKAYLTKIQIGQFWVPQIYLIAIVVKGCQSPNATMFWTITNTSVFILLFVNFYRKTYTSGQGMNEKGVRSENIKKST
uniref:Elongation of very long chain fatty acids protein n=1 Tax=Glossina palpalis gambiensis TaxID=67801 RepID=A0A1B0AU17_9MUSC